MIRELLQDPFDESTRIDPRCSHYEDEVTDGREIVESARFHTDNLSEKRSFDAVAGSSLCLLANDAREFFKRETHFTVVPVREVDGFDESPHVRKMWVLRLYAVKAPD